MTRSLRVVVGALGVMLLVGGAQAQSLAAEIDTVMAEYARLDQFSGTVLVARGGDILYAEAFGEANKDHHVANILETRFNIGSIGKTFTGVAIMQLVERGALELDAPVVRYLPDFPYGDAITIHHLLSHTSGLSNYMAHPDYRASMPRLRDIDDFLPLIYDQQLVFDTPGEAFAYSNSGIVVLGAVIERLTGAPYEEYLRDNILGPTGMTDTGVNFWDEVVPNRAVGYTRGLSGDVSSDILRVPPASADGGLETTVLDLLKFDRALYGDQLLSEPSKTRMFTPAGVSLTAAGTHRSGTAAERPVSVPASCGTRTTTSPSSSCRTTRGARSSRHGRWRRSCSDDRTTRRDRHRARSCTGRSPRAGSEMRKGSRP